MTTTTASRAVHTGPTWERAPDGRWRLPRQTLGWDVLEWTARYLLQPDGVNAGQPWRFTPEQARFVLWWYAVDEAGAFVYRRGVLRRRKGWGKDPFGMALSVAEWLGPCRFGGWNADGTPRASEVHTSRVQIVAVAMHQAKRNSMSLLPAMLSPAAKADYGIDLGLELSRANGGRSVIELVTSSPGSLEGGRPSFVLENETQNWLERNKGHDMAEVTARNLAKSPDGSARSLAICNAHIPGYDSVAERDYEAHLLQEQGRTVSTGFLYDALEAPADTEMAAIGTGEGGEVTDEDRARARASLMAGLSAAKGDSYWLNDERTIEEIYDPTTDPSISRRFYLNQIVAAEDAWLAPHEWDACKREGERVTDGEIVTLGFDGSKTGDHSVLVGCRVSDSHLFIVEAWDPEARANHEVPMDEVDATVRQAFARWDVVAFWSDYHPFESYVDRWEQELAGKLCAPATSQHAIRWEMRAGGRVQEVTRATEAYHDAIVSGDLTHDGDARLAQYHYNARRRPNNYGTAFGKETAFSARKVDGVAASMLARTARQAYLALPEGKRRKQTYGWVVR